jgi:hypothetical protein
MEVGEVVVRAYAHHAIVPGIIIEKKEIKYPSDWEEEDHGDIHIETNYLVAWSDYSETWELWEELDYLEDVIKQIHTYR